MNLFVDRVAQVKAGYEFTLLRVLFPGLKNGLRSQNELVRAELLGVISYSIQKCEAIAVLQEMRPLFSVRRRGSQLLQQRTACADSSSGKGIA